MKGGEAWADKLFFEAYVSKPEDYELGGCCGISGKDGGGQDEGHHCYGRWTALVWFASFYPHHHLLSAKQQPSGPCWSRCGNPCLEEASLMPPQSNPASFSVLGSCSLLGFGGCIWQVELALWCFYQKLEFVFIFSQCCESFFPLPLSYVWSCIVVIPICE